MLAHYLYRKPHIPVLPRGNLLLRSRTQGYFTAVNSFTQAHPVRQKEEGSIASVFTSLSSDIVEPLPNRFADLKKEIWKDSLIQSWREVLAELETVVDEISVKGGAVSVPSNPHDRDDHARIYDRVSHEYLMLTLSMDYRQSRSKQ